MLKVHKLAREAKLIPLQAIQQLEIDSCEVDLSIYFSTTGLSSQTKPHSGKKIKYLFAVADEGIWVGIRFLANRFGDFVNEIAKAYPLLSRVHW